MSQPTPSPATSEARSSRKTEIGIVTSDKMNKSRRVEIETLVPHPKYGKLMRRRAFRNHMLAKKQSSLKREYVKEFEVASGDTANIKRMLGTYNAR